MHSLFQNQTKAFKLFHFVFSVVILIASLKTVIEAGNVSNWPLLILAGVETIAVIFFIFPKYTKISGMVLIAIFLLAIVLSLLTGVIMSELHLIVYLVCTYFIVVHGNVFPDDSASVN